VIALGRVSLNLPARPFFERGYMKKDSFKIGDLYRCCREKKTYYLRCAENSTVFLENSHDPGHMITETIDDFNKKYQLEAVK
jgi:hypothetical protein